MVWIKRKWKLIGSSWMKSATSAWKVAARKWKRRKRNDDDGNDEATAGVTVMTIVIVTVIRLTPLPPVESEKNIESIITVVVVIIIITAARRTTAKRSGAIINITGARMRTAAAIHQMAKIIERNLKGSTKRANAAKGMILVMAKMRGVKEVSPHWQSNFIAEKSDDG